MESNDNVFSRLDEAALRSIEEAIQSDPELQAVVSNGQHTSFNLACKDNNSSLAFVITKDQTKAYLHPSTKLELQFTLSAQSTHWNEVFEAVPKRPFQSYWGMLRLLGAEAGVEVSGDQTAFTAFARLWRLVIDLVRDALHHRTARTVETGFVEEDELDDDSIVGHYLWVKLPEIGKCKVFYETSGMGAQPLLFLHTAGADSRQYHSLMMNKTLQQKCTMYAFDLPGHGRSFPGEHQYPAAYSNSEEFYISAIGQMISRLGIHRVIVSGASMGGQVCLAVALRATELDVSGVIPCEACDYIPEQRAQKIYSLTGDESVLNPERVCGMIAPTSPAIYKRLNWWIYSSQATKIFPGDLKFYFEGWDGRDRVSQIDTKVCPVYMLTGEYDYSCSPDMSRETATKIKGAVFEEMLGLGHFPMSEDPARFLPYFFRALEHIHEHSIS